MHLHFKRLSIVFALLGLGVGCAHAAGPSPQDTGGPNVFSFVSANYYVLEDATNAWIAVSMRPGDRGWSGVIDYFSLDGTATAPTDYTSVSNRLGIGWPGVRSFPVPVVLDSKVEGEETVQLRLASSNGSLVEQGVATLHILEADSGRVSFRNSTYRVNELQSHATIALIRTGQSKGELTVWYRTASWFEGTIATEGTDYTPIAGTLTFADGETNKTILLPIFDDQTNGRTRLVRLLISDDVGNARIGRAYTDVLIEDNVPPRLEIGSDLEGRLILSWTASCSDFVLEGALGVGATGWAEVTQPAVVEDGVCKVSEAVSGSGRVYRLRKAVR